MVALTTLDDRRRSRNIVFAALILLIIIWSLKLAYPQHTILGVYQSQRPPTALPTSPPTAPKSKNPTADRWKTKPAEDTSSLSHHQDAFNGTLSNKAAVIIETRFRSNLIPLILHFSSVLGHSWPILIYTSAECVGLFAASAALSRYLRTGVIQVRILPQTTLITSSDSASAFMMTEWLWKDLAPAEHILHFHSDSMLCANAARSVDDFFEYDLIGAPLSEDVGEGFNGGLSLRKRSTVLKILELYSEEEDERKDEGQWYYKKMKALVEEEVGSEIDPTSEGAIDLPTMEVARTFSVESLDYPHPLGVHGVHKLTDEQKTTLNDWCPEYQLCSEK